MSKIIIDGAFHDVRIVIKKKLGSNHFYIHHIDTKKFRITQPILKDGNLRDSELLNNY